MIRWFVFLLLALTAPVRAQEAVARFGAQDALELRFRSTTDIAILQPALEAFVEENPDLAVLYEQWGSNALYQHSQKACDGDTTVADALLSSAVHQMVDLVNSACAASYRSATTLALPEARRWRDEVWGVAQEPAVIIYNTDLVPESDTPESRFALLDLMRQKPDAYAGKIATYDIEASGLGYLFAFHDSLEATTFGALLESFARTEAVATCCSAEIIQGVAEGRYLMAYNVLGSYVDASSLPTVGVIYPSDYTLFLSRAFMIPRQAAHVDEAGRLLEFLLSPEGQSILSSTGLVDQKTSDETGLVDSAKRPIVIAPPLIVALDQHRRARFITQWRQTFRAAVVGRNGP